MAIVILIAIVIVEDEIVMGQGLKRRTNESSTLAVGLLWLGLEP